MSLHGYADSEVAVAGDTGFTLSKTVRDVIKLAPRAPWYRGILLISRADFSVAKLLLIGFR